MTPKTLIVGTLLFCAASTSQTAVAESSPGAMVESYEALVENILAVRRLESGFVGALLDGHRRAAEDLMRRGEFKRAAAEMTLFANEGDGAIGGIRERLVEAGHRHHADPDRRGGYDPGFVIVTRAARLKLLAAAAAFERATSDGDRQEAWAAFALEAEALLMAD